MSVIRKSFQSESGVVHILPLLFIVIVVGVVSYLLISSTAPFKGGLFGNIYPKPESQAASYTCGQITGFSVTSEIFWGSTVTSGVPDGGTSPFQGVIGNNNWQLYWGSGGAISRYADPSNGIWTFLDPNQDPTSGYHIESRCSSNTGSPEVWAQMISDTSYNNDPNYWRPLIVATINNIHTKFPSVRQIFLSPLGITHNNQICPTSDPQSQFGAIRATYNESAMMQAITSIVSSGQFSDVAQGYIPYVNSCSEYRDWGGHLIDSTAARFSGEMGNFYSSALSGGSPLPSATTRPTSTPLPAGTNNVSFDDHATGILNGQYPSGLIDWGSNVWLDAGPFSVFNTNSVSFNGASLTQGSFNFVSPRRIVSLQAVNGGSGNASVTIACASNPTVTQSVPVNQPVTITTNWANNCSGPVAITSSNGWNTNIDNLLISSGGSSTSPPTPTPSPTPVADINFGGRVYLDSNADGIFQVGEAGVANRLLLLNGSDLCTTGADGTCAAFGRISVGQTYSVSHSVPSGYINTSPIVVQGVAQGGASGTQLVNFGIRLMATSTPRPAVTPTPRPSTATPTPISTQTPISSPIAQGQNNIFGNVTPNIANDTNAYELGVKFRSSVPGMVTGIRYYKSANNTGAHTASLWNTAGTRLATATFTNESTTGWQQVAFAVPVVVAANTTYIASYHDNTGGYGQLVNGFTNSGVTNGVLSALPAGVDGGNGVFAPGTVSSFPNQTWNNSNYYVDVLFTPVIPGTDTTLGFDSNLGTLRIDSSLTGQSPTGLINWGNPYLWLLSGPWLQFRTNSFSFYNGNMSSGTFSFVTPKVLVSVKAFNGGNGSADVTITCAGNVDRRVSVGVNQIATITTGWNNPCTSVTIATTNSWNTNFDDLIYR